MDPYCIPLKYLRHWTVIKKLTDYFWGVGWEWQGAYTDTIIRLKIAEVHMMGRPARKLLGLFRTHLSDNQNETLKPVSLFKQFWPEMWRHTCSSLSSPSPTSVGNHASSQTTISWHMYQFTCWHTFTLWYKAGKNLFTSFPSISFVTYLSGGRNLFNFSPLTTQPKQWCLSPDDCGLFLGSRFCQNPWFFSNLVFQALICQTHLWVFIYFAHIFSDLFSNCLYSHSHMWKLAVYSNQ